MAAADAGLFGLPHLRPPKACLPERKTRMRMLDASHGDASGAAVLGSLGVTGWGVRSPGVNLVGANAFAHLPDYLPFVS